MELNNFAAIHFFVFSLFFRAFRVMSGLETKSTNLAEQGKCLARMRPSKRIQYTKPKYNQKSSTSEK